MLTDKELRWLKDRPDYPGLYARYWPHHQGAWWPDCVENTCQHWAYLYDSGVTVPGKKGLWYAYNWLLGPDGVDGDEDFESLVALNLARGLGSTTVRAGSGRHSCSFDTGRDFPLPCSTEHVDPWAHPCAYRDRLGSCQACQEFHRLKQARIEVEEHMFWPKH